MMVARLENEEQRLVTAWWYDNGQQQTLSNFDWRWQQLQGESGFFLVNVTVANRDQLESAVMDWQQRDVVAGLERVTTPPLSLGN